MTYVYKFKAFDFNVLDEITPEFARWIKFVAENDVKDRSFKGILAANNIVTFRNEVSEFDMQVAIEFASEADYLAYLLKL